MGGGFKIGNVFKNFNFGQALQVGGALYGAKQTMAQAEAEANALNFQAGQYEQQSDNIRHAGVQEGVDLARKTRKFKSQQVAQLAANGMDISSGSAQDILESTDQESLLDQAAILHNAGIASYEALGNAAMARAAAKNAIVAGKTRMIGGLIGAASQFADNWTKWKKAGGDEPSKKNGGSPGSNGKSGVQFSGPIIK